VEAFESLAGGLIPTVDDETAEIVARKLAPFPATPQSVLAALAARGGEIRDLVIAQAPDLSALVIEAALADTDLPAEDYPLYVIIGAEGPWTPTDLARRLMLPGEMGEIFKVIALGRGYHEPLAGFGTRELPL
jgi:hypothetical protein